MPINTLKQAVIELSIPQAIAIGELAQVRKDQRVVALRIEETNLGNAVAVTTQRGTSIIDHAGTVTLLEKRGA